MSTPKPNLRLEIAAILLLLLIGGLALPPLIYFVGLRLFGAYRVDGGGGLSFFYFDFLHGLAAAQPAAWTIALGPLLVVYLVRAIRGDWSVSAQSPDEPRQPERVEPTIHS